MDTPKKITASDVPWWLQLLLGVFQILEPQFAWIAEVIALAYQIWQDLPWFHKAGALIEMRAAVKKAKAISDTGPLLGFNARWTLHTAKT